MSRRSPWGPPWWIYGLAFGTANLIRQVVIIATPAEVPQSIRVASWVATVLVAIAVVNGVASLLQRRNVAAAQASETAGCLTVGRIDDRHQASPNVRWAPWWVYLVIVVGANYVRRAAFPDSGTPAVDVLVALGFSAVLFVIITVAYRASRR